MEWCGFENANKIERKKVTSIMEKQQIELEIPEGKSNLEVTRFGNKSNRIVVKDGDVIEIRSTELYKKSVSLSLPIGAIMGAVLIFLIPNLIHRVIIVVVFLATITIAQLVLKLFRVKVVSDKDAHNI